MSGRTHSLFRPRRKARRTERYVIIAVVLLLCAITAVLVRLSPREAEKPLITVYASENCAHCLRWMAYLENRGFRTIKSKSESREIRGRLKIPAKFSAPVIATVDELVVQGFVPAREIHRAIDGKLGKSIIGVIVPGTPRGAPGVAAAVPETFTVYAVLPGGMLRPVATYNESPHMGGHAYPIR